MNKPRFVLAFLLGVLFGGAFIPVRTAAATVYGDINRIANALEKIEAKMSSCR